MLRLLVLALAVGGALAGLWALSSFGPTSDVVTFGRIAVVVALLALAAALPLWLSARADHDRVPWRTLARFIERETPFEAAVLAMLAVAMVVAVFPWGAATPIAWLVLGAVAVLFVAASTVEQLFPYVPGTTEA